MIWYYAEDSYYYQDKEFTQGKLILPSEDEVVDAIRKKGYVEVLASYLPSERLKPLFTVIELENKHGVLTTQDYKFLENVKDKNQRESLEAKIIEEKVGLKIYKTKGIKLEGASSIKRFILGIKDVSDPKLRPKGIFLVGLPGTGKSYSAKFAASQLDAYLVELNLSKILESNNPVFTLHSIFKYLENTSKQGMRYVLWIDEIEKMFVGEETEKRVFGQLLTILNDMNTSTGYQINGVFWVTANNITDIMSRNPEFLRKGRFDELFFIDNPLHQDAMKIAKMYKDYYGFTYYNTKKNVAESFESDMIELSENVVYYTETMGIGAKETNRFIYVAAEIQQIAKQMALRKHLNEKFLKEPENQDSMIRLLYPAVVVGKISKYIGIPLTDYSQFLEIIKKAHKEALEKSKAQTTDLDLIVVLSTIEPLSVSMKEAISKMRSQERLFVKGD